MLFSHPTRSPGRHSLSSLPMGLLSLEPCTGAMEGLRSALRLVACNPLAKRLGVFRTLRAQLELDLKISKTLAQTENDALEFDSVLQRNQDALAEVLKAIDQKATAVTSQASHAASQARTDIGQAMAARQSVVDEPLPPDLHMERAIHQLAAKMEGNASAKTK